MPSLRKPWFIALLLVALLSQSVAALTMKCELQQQHDVSHAMMGMDHAMSDMPHEMDLMSAETENLNHSSDCCNTMERCVSGSCSLPALSHYLPLSPILVTTIAPVDAYDSRHPIPSISSLYRPPIFR
jgi:hypothetical protein